MQDNSKIHLKLNLFDTIVLVVALFIGAFLLCGRLLPASMAADNPSQPDSVPMLRYTIRLQGWAPGTHELIREGDQITDNIKNHNLGHVVSAEAVPARFQSLDREARRYVWAETDALEDVILTIEAPYVHADGSITVDGDYAIRVGNTIHLRGEGYMGSGPIVKIEEVRSITPRLKPGACGSNPTGPD